MHIKKPEHEVTIDSLSNSGDGVARVDSRVMFVPYTAPGDKVRVQVTKEKKSFMLARTLELLSPGELRTEPKCSHFQQCGGCDWQHIQYPAQLVAKTGQLQETLERIAGLTDLQFAPIEHSENPFSYRNRLQGEIRDGKFYMHQKLTGAPVAISRCEIADDAINQLLSEPLAAKLKGRVELSLFEDESTIVSLKDKRTSELGFRQVNNEIAERLVIEMLSLVADSSCSQVLDLYCGRGDWTCRIAADKPESNVIGIDSLKENITAAMSRRKTLQLSNLSFQHSTVESQAAKLALGNSLCIVDPPRAGLAPELIDALQNNPAPELIYVSCHPATLARDLKLLCAKHYRVETIKPFDMFPQTAHLETLVHLRLAHKSRQH